MNGWVGITISINFIRMYLLEPLCTIFLFVPPSSLKPPFPYTLGFLPTHNITLAVLWVDISTSRSVCFHWFSPVQTYLMLNVKTN